MTFHFGGHLYEAEVKGRAVKLKLPAARNLDQSVGILEETGLEEGGSVNTGVPHYVLFGREIDKTNVIAVGRKYRYHPHFQPHGTNVNFVEVAGDEEIRVRTYERGVEDETLSCGSGSVASAFLAHLQKEVSFPVRVRTRGGVLVVHKNQEAAQFYLEGKVEPVYQGKLKAFR